MVYLFKAQAGEKIPFSFYDEIDGIINGKGKDDPLICSGESDGGYIEWSIEPLPGVTMEQAQTVFNALWPLSGELDPTVTARLFEK